MFPESLGVRLQETLDTSGPGSLPLLPLPLLPLPLLPLLALVASLPCNDISSACCCPATCCHAKRLLICWPPCSAARWSSRGDTATG